MIFRNMAMRKIVFAFLFIGSFISISACQKECSDQFLSTGRKLIVNITAGQSDTKTVLYGTETKWKTGDMVTVMYKKEGNNNWYTSQSGAASSSDEFATATFSVTLDEPNTEVSAYAIYPANSITQSVQANAKIPISPIQYPSGTSFDGNSDVLISQPFTPSSSVSTLFSRASAVLKIKVQNPSLSSEKLLSLSVTGENDLAGDIQVGLSDHTVKNTVQNSSKTVTAIYSESKQFTIGEPEKYVYLIVKPQTLANGSTLTVNGVTENYTFTKDIILENAIHLNAGHIIPLNISITSVTPKLGWYRVEDESWLHSGDFVVIANHNNTSIMSSTQHSDNYRVGLEITVENKKITYFNNDAQLFILETGTKVSSFAFWCNNGNKFNNYLYSGANNNSLTSQSSLNDYSSFIATLADDGYGSLTGQGGNSNNMLRYNNTNTRFCCYASGQQNISIYKYYGGYPGQVFGFATFRFNKAEDLTTLGITPPLESTDLDNNTNYTLGDVIMTISHGSTNTRIWNKDGKYDLRLYPGGGSLLFDAGAGKTIKKIEFVASNGTTNFDLTSPSGSFTSTYVWDAGEASIHSVSFTPNTKNNYISVVRVTLN